MAKDQRNVEAITPMEEDFTKWYTDICLKAELVDYASVKGFMILRPYGYAIWENIQRIMDGMFKKTGHVNVAMPVLIPESLLKKEGELVEGFAPEVAWVTMGGSEKLEERLAFRPTSETMFCDHWHNVLQSYRELPMLYNQWCSVIRWEKTTRPFLRSREFWWQEGHTIHETAEEAEAKRRRGVDRKVRAAGFPFVKTLADFDFSFQPSIPRAVVDDLATLRFLDAAENVVLVGSPGVGKTHIAVALGVEAVRARKEVRFTDCAALVRDLKDASSRGILAKRLKYYAHASLLIIDELGYLDVDEEGADLLFQLVSARYEHRSTVITTNVAVGLWADVFGDAVTAAAIADRVCHHCTMLKITGRSYRMKDLLAEAADGDGLPERGQS